jgi:redox-sensitive bicupin YhaK (pirin superfamily)
MEEEVERKLVMLNSAPSGLEGEGFPVKRAFYGVPYEMLDPFVHMDQMGEVDYGLGEPKGTPWHPHRGFETVTYMLEGTFVHKDSNGGGGIITSGDTQWMTAGNGILHIETPPEELVAKGGLFHGIQLWVNLKSSLKYVNSRYQDIGSTQIKTVFNEEKDGSLKIIAGEILGTKGPGITYSPINMAHLNLLPGSHFKIPWNPEFNCLIYALTNAATITSDRIKLSSGQLGVLSAGTYFEIYNPFERTFDAILLGGLPIKEPVVAYGPFVMNTKAEIKQAFEDYEAGRLGRIPANN